MSEKKIIFSGAQPSGKMTLGNYLGAIQNWTKLQDEYDCFYSVVDLHAITVPQEAKNLRANTMQLLAQYLACGLDPEKNTIFIQSHVSAHTELMWILNTMTYMGELSRMTQFKDKSQKSEANLNAGLFTYPVLMAADILLYQTDLVPVGEDQLPMIEQAREVVRKFNNIYGETLVEPEALVGKMARVKGLDGNSKMGKSLGNAIYISDSEEEITKKVMGAVTDTTKIRKDDPADPEKCMVGYYHKIFSGDDTKCVFSECREGKRGCVACKKELAKNICEYLKPMREKRRYYEENPEIIDSILKDGINKARKKSKETLKKVKEAMKINYFE